MLAEFEVRNCCGDFVKSVEWDVADDIANEAVANDFDGLWSEWDLSNEYTGRIFGAAGINNFQCGSCYDSAYRVHFVRFIDKAGQSGCAVKATRKLVVTIEMPEPNCSQIDGVDDCGDLQDLISSIANGYFDGKITWERG